MLAELGHPQIQNQAAEIGQHCWGVGKKRNTESIMDFLHELRGRVIGQPEIQRMVFILTRIAIRDAFGDSASASLFAEAANRRRLCVTFGARQIRSRPNSESCKFGVVHVGVANLCPGLDSRDAGCIGHGARPRQIDEGVARHRHDPWAAGASRAPHSRQATRRQERLHATLEAANCGGPISAVATRPLTSPSSSLT